MEWSQCNIQMPRLRRKIRRGMAWMKAARSTMGTVLTECKSGTGEMTGLKLVGWFRLVLDSSVRVACELGFAGR
jgi:hypothetical protein